jgi:hypothetical protein
VAVAKDSEFWLINSQPCVWDTVNLSLIEGSIVKTLVGNNFQNVEDILTAFW